MGWLAFFVRGWASIITRNLNMFTLISLGTGVAYLYSIIAVVFPAVFPASFRDIDGKVDIYFEAAAMIITLVLLGQVLELKARNSTGAAIRSLLGMAPKIARRLRDDGEEEEIPLIRCRSETACAFAPGKKSRSTGLLSTGSAPSMNR